MGLTLDQEVIIVDNSVHKSRDIVLGFGLADVGRLNLLKKSIQNGDVVDILQFQTHHGHNSVELGLCDRVVG